MRHACSSASMPAPSGGSGALSVGTLGTSAMAVRPLQAAILFRLFTKVRNLVSCMNSNSYFGCLSYDAKRQRTGVHGVSFSDSPGRVQPQRDRREGMKDFRYPFRKVHHTHRFRFAANSEPGSREPRLSQPMFITFTRSRRSRRSALHVAIHVAATPCGPHRHGVVVTAALCIAFCAAGLCAET